MAPSYRKLQQYAIAISTLSVVYNGLEGGVSIGFGIESGSRSLIFFGIQSAVEIASSIVVLWRFKHVAKPGEEKTVVLNERDLRLEKYATLVIGCLFILLALGAEGSSIAALVLHDSPETSDASLIISATALVIMILIWFPKRWLSSALDSSAMRAEADCSLACVQITVVLFIGSLVFRLWSGGWWIDSATNMILGLLFAKQGIEMVRWARDPGFNGGCCKSCDVPPPAEELGERYRDVCACCHEKEECKAADSCQCSGIQTSTPESRNLCCVPVDAEGKKCCSREMVAGSRPATEQQAPAGNSCCSGC